MDVGEFFQNILRHPFTWGLVLGIIIGMLLWLSSIGKRRELKTKVNQLQNHLNNQMEIQASGTSAMRKELEELRKHNENLRVTVKSLQNKPGRAEIRLLEIYDRTVRNLNHTAPSFGAVWEEAFQKAEKEIEQADSGIVSMVRKALRPSQRGLPTPDEQKERRNDKVEEPDDEFYSDSGKSTH